MVTITATAVKIIMLAFPMAWVSQFYSDSDGLRNSDSDPRHFRLPITEFNHESWDHNDSIRF
jgi:hypothetical protein